MPKYFYLEGYCPIIKYLSLNPAIYDRDNTGKYKKVRMDCSVSTETCRRDCPVFASAGEYLSEADEWRLRDKKIGG